MFRSVRQRGECRETRLLFSGECGDGNLDRSYFRIFPSFGAETECLHRTAAVKNAYLLKRKRQILWRQSRREVITGGSLWPCLLDLLVIASPVRRGVGFVEAVHASAQRDQKQRTTKPPWGLLSPQTGVLQAEYSGAYLMPHYSFTVLRAERFVLFAGRKTDRSTIGLRQRWLEMGGHCSSETRSVRRRSMLRVCSACPVVHGGPLTLCRPLQASQVSADRMAGLVLMSTVPTVRCPWAHPKGPVTLSGKRRDIEAAAGRCRSSSGRSLSEVEPASELHTDHETRPAVCCYNANGRSSSQCSTCL